MAPDPTLVTTKETKNFVENEYKLTQIRIVEVVNYLVQNDHVQPIKHKGAEHVNQYTTNWHHNMFNWSNLRLLKSWQ